MIVICVGSKKGGVGKTTIATNLASCFASRGKTLLIDADEQKSSMFFRETRENAEPTFQAVSILTNTIHHDVKGFDHEFVVIDTGGRDSKVFRSALAAADIFIIPVRPGQYDILSTEETLEIIEEFKSIGKEIPTMLLKNMVNTNKRLKITGEASVALDDIAQRYKVGVFETQICERNAFELSAEMGRGVVEVADDRFFKAADEFNNFFNELLERI